MRNIDRLRKMNDEEIFNFIRTDKFCYNMAEDECDKYNDCRDCKIAWLKKEYKGDDNND